MKEQTLVKQILCNNEVARQCFIERYSGAILRGLVRKCRANCLSYNCPMRFGLNQRNLEKTRCDELAELYLFSLESLFKELRFYRNDKSLDDWVHDQTNPNGFPFRQRFAAYMAKKYPLTGRARIPDRFQHCWSKTQKRVYQEWLRQRTVSEIAVKVKLSEAEAQSVLLDILAQLTEAGLLGTLEEGVRIERFQQRERSIYEYTQSRSEPRGKNPANGQNSSSTTNKPFDSSNPLESVRQPQVGVFDVLLVQALQRGVECAFTSLSSCERRLLVLKFDGEWTLREIAEQSDSLGLGKLTPQRVGHMIDKILRKMLPTINRALAVIEDISLQLPALKRVLLEWGTN